MLLGSKCSRPSSRLADPHWVVRGNLLHLKHHLSKTSIIFAQDNDDKLQPGTLAVYLGMAAALDDSVQAFLQEGLYEHPNS